MDVRKSVIVLISVMLVVQLAEACYISTSMNNGRLTDVALTVANDRIFIAGGSSGNSVSPVVNIFTPRTNSWEQIQLPKARKSIVAASLGSQVLFAGGLDQQNQPYNSMDIYDFRTSQWLTLNIDTRHVIKGSVVARSQAFFYTEQDELVIVNPTSNSTSTMSHTGRFVDAASNATHIFFLVYQGNTPNIEIFNIDERTWSSVPSSAPFTEINRIFHAGNVIVLIGRQQGHAMSLRTTFQRGFTFSNDASDVAHIINVGADLVVLTRDSVTVATMPAVSTTTYNINRTAIIESNLVVHNNIVYFTGHGADSVSATELFRFDLSQLLQRIDLPGFLSAPTDAEFGFLFWLQPTIGTITTMNLRQRSIDVFHTSFKNYFNAVGVRVGSEYLMVSSDPNRLGEGASVEYDVFNFNMQTVTTRRMSNPLTATSATALDNYAVFTTVTNFLHVYEGHRGTWFRVFSEQPTQFAAIISHNIIMVHSTMIETYHLNTREFNMYNITRPTSDVTKTLYFSSTVRVFICDRTANGGTAIATYRHRTHDITYHYCDYPVESITQVLGFVMFNVITPTHPQKMFVYYIEEDNDSHDLREITLPVNEANPYDKRPALYTSTREFLYLVRPGRVDVLDVTDWTITHLPFFVIGQPHQVLLVGSKLLIHHTLNDVQQVLVYERSTQEMQSIVFGGLASPLVFDTTDNIIYTVNNMRFMMMPFTSIASGLRDTSEFLGGTTFFSVRAMAAVGTLNASWRHNSQPIDNTDVTLRLSNVTEEMAGEYSVEVFDQCGHRVVSSARLQVDGRPVFEVPLQYSTILCGEPTEIEVSVTGRRVTYTWTINGIDHDRPETSVVIHEEKIQCNSEGTLCVTATNPAGSSSSCANVRVLPIESVFKGPAPMAEQQNWFSGNEATLHVSVLDDHCRSHEWFVENTSVGRFYTSESTLNVSLSRDIEGSKIFVRTYCGSGVITSRAFSFNQVSLLTVTELAVIIVTASVVFIAAVIIIVVVLRKRKKSAPYKKMDKYELELFSTKPLSQM